MRLRPVDFVAHSCRNAAFSSQHKAVPRDDLAARTNARAASARAIALIKETLIYDEPPLRDPGCIFAEDVDDDRTIYIIQEGYVDILRLRKVTGPDGTERVQVNEQGHPDYVEEQAMRLQPGDCFGQSCLFYLRDDAEYTRNYSAIAATDCKLLMLNRAAIDELKRTVPEAIEHMKPRAVRRLERLRKRALETLQANGAAVYHHSDATDSSTLSTVAKQVSELDAKVDQLRDVIHKMALANETSGGP